MTVSEGLWIWEVRAVVSVVVIGSVSGAGAVISKMRAKTALSLLCVVVTGCGWTVLWMEGWVGVEVRLVRGGLDGTAGIVGEICG